jgi:hypothetical protein
MSVCALLTTYSQCGGRQLAQLLVFVLRPRRWWGCGGDNSGTTATASATRKSPKNSMREGAAPWMASWKPSQKENEIVEIISVKTASLGRISGKRSHVLLARIMRQTST